MQKESSNFNKNPEDCLSKLTQAHFYWICNSIAGAFWLHDIDITPVSDNFFIFSKEEQRPKFSTGSFEKFLLKDTMFHTEEKGKSFSIGNFLRDGW